MINKYLKLIKFEMILSISSSVHHMYQLDRGDNWSPWQTIGRPSSTVGSLPKVTEYVAGWWAVHFVDKAGSKVSELTHLIKT